MNPAMETPVKHSCVAQRQRLVTMWNEQYPGNVTHEKLLHNVNMRIVRRRLRRELPGMNKKEQMEAMESSRA